MKIEGRRKSTNVVDTRNHYKAVDEGAGWTGRGRRKQKIEDSVDTPNVAKGNEPVDRAIAKAVRNSRTRNERYNAEQTDKRRAKRESDAKSRTPWKNR